MRSSTLAVAIAGSLLVQQAVAAGFVEDSKASISSRTLYYDNDPHQGGADQKETGTALRADFISGFTQGTIGFGLDVQGVSAWHLDGGRGHHPTNNTLFPSDSDGSSEDSFGAVGATGKLRFSKTEVKYGNTLTPNLPILVANDARLLPQVFEGGSITSKEIKDLTLTAGQLEHQRGRASTDYSGLALAGGTQESNKFRFAGGDWKVTKDLTLQYYYANLEDYYKQNFLGLLHVLPIGEDQSLKTDLRYFNNRSDGKNSNHTAGYSFNNNSGYASHPGEVDNNTWSAMFTYTLGSHSLLLGHQQVSDNGGMVYLGQGSLADAEGAGGSSFYLFTDSMINGFNRAGENTSFGQYSYDFAHAGVPGLRTSISYLYGNDIRRAAGNGGDQHEQESDLRVDYVVQSGPFKGLGTSLRHGIYRGEVLNSNGSKVQDANQTRLIFNYTYNFF